MNARRTRLLASAVAAAATALVACGSTPIEGPTGGGADPDTVVLRVTRAGGYTSRSYAVRILPALTIYADGRLVALTVVDQIDDRRAIDAVVVRQIDDEGMRRVNGEIERSGFLERPGRDFGSPGVTDIPTTTVELSVAGVGATQSAYALDPTFSRGGQLTSAQIKDRAALRGLIARLTDIEAVAGPEHVGRALPLVAESFTMESVVAPGRDGESPVKAVAWPLPNVDLSPTERCAEIRGDDATTLRLALSDERDQTEYTQRGVRYVVAIRPVLPGETPCPGGEEAGASTVSEG